MGGNLPTLLFAKDPKQTAKHPKQSLGFPAVHGSTPTRWWGVRTSCTHPRPLPEEGNGWLFAEEEGGVTGGEVRVLEEAAPAQALLL